MGTTLYPSPQPLLKFLFDGPIFHVKNIGDVNATNVLVRQYLNIDFILLEKDKIVSFSTITVGETKQARIG